MTWVEALRAREGEFRRAPSAHNTQPWTLDYLPDEIRIGSDPARSLPHSDPTGRDLALGLGALTETMMIIAAGLGLPVRVDSSPGDLRLVPAADVPPTPFTAVDVAARRVARGRYLPGPLDPAVLAEVTDLAGLAPSPAGPVAPPAFGLVALPSRVLTGELRAADRWMFGTPAVTRELSEWLRLTPRHPRYAEDGLTDRALCLTGAEAVLLRAALAAYPIGRRLGLGRLLAASGGGVLGHDGTVLVLTATAPTEAGLAPTARIEAGRIEAGRVLLRVWLALGRHGLAVHPLSQLIDCPATAARLATRVGAAPLAVFRVGRPQSEPVRSARLRIA